MTESLADKIKFQVTRLDSSVGPHGVEPERSYVAGHIQFSATCTVRDDVPIIVAKTKICESIYSTIYREIREKLSDFYEKSSQVSDQNDLMADLIKNIHILIDQPKLKEK